jgi:hypothetical protein
MRSRERFTFDSSVPRVCSKASRNACTLLSDRPAEARLAELERRPEERLAVERLDEARLELDRLEAARLGFAALFDFAVVFGFAALLGFAAARLRVDVLDFFDPPELVATCFSSFGAATQGLSHVEQRLDRGVV